MAMEITQPYLPEDETLPPPDTQGSMEFDNTLKTPAPELTLEEKDFIKHAVEKRPETVETHVKKAAEQDKPVEAIYEKRAEIKDEPQPMEPIGSVLANKTAGQNPIAVPAPAPVPPPIYPVAAMPSSTMPKKENRLKSARYARSMRIGFIGGIVSAVAFVAIYLLI